ncbi:MAG: hypothetical protein IPL27_17080 [Lewinellaceae bacterium]|nr:hypothetical protein [Lewinellaceae bacterium]
MTGQFQSWLFTEITKKLPARVTLAKEIGGLLALSSGTVYKKMRGEVPLSLEEALTLMQHYRISADRFLAGDKSVLLRYSAFDHPVSTPPDYLAGLEQQLIGLRQLPNPNIWYATYELPIFYYLYFPELIAFKLYLWGRVNWQTPVLRENPFHPDAFAALYPTLEALRTRVLNLYASIPSREFWPVHTLENTLGQIRLCAMSHLMEKSVALDLCDMLYKLTDYIGHFAAAGKKTSEDGSVTNDFDLYLNQMMYTNNTILVRSDIYKVVFTTLDNPNYLNSDDLFLIQTIETWMERLRQNTTKISLEGELRRNYMLHQMKLRIEAHQTELKTL